MVCYILAIILAHRSPTMTDPTASTGPDGQPRILNRELGNLAFNERVLALAEDPQVPLLERLRYVCIVSSNLDEFFEIRVAGLKQELLHDARARTPDDLALAEIMQLISTRSRALVARQYALFNQTLVPELEQAGVAMIQGDQWTEAQEEWARGYFESDVLPVLTPIGLDPAHPFPRVLNKSLNFIVELEGVDAFGRDSGIAIVQAPRVLPRVIRMPAEVARVADNFITLGAILRRFMQRLFPGMTVVGCHEFRVTRNSDLFVDDEEVKNLRTALEGELFERHFGDAVRLEVTAGCTERMVGFLMQQFGLKPLDVYRVNGPVNLVRLNQIPDLIDRPELKFAAFRPGLPKDIRRFWKPDADLFAVIAGRDVLLHHPYQTFQPVLDFLRAASVDPAVVAIKQTIYRTGSESALMETLIQAARNGKEVTVVVELKARFDEETNINWASRLEEVGAHVVYGVVGYKTHAKMLLVVRREGARLRRYAHLSTGNYHIRTARLYTDFGLFTANPALCEDVNELFKQLTGLGRASDMNHLWQAPFTLHARVMEAIAAEAAIAAAGRPAHIIARMNALLEPQVIEALYAASQAGVRIDLIVRGVCALRPQVPGLSDNIRVRSVIGRFLEHSRVFYFHADGREDVYLSSADWMYRNFFRRIETCFPVLDRKLRERVMREGLRLYLKDSSATWIMNAAGEYAPPARASAARSPQAELLRLLAAGAEDEQ
jgi:polyphosphate kinase